MTANCFKDMTGMRFGKWLVVRQAAPDAEFVSTMARWICRCDCGTERTVAAGSLRTSISRSCGCAPRSGTSAPIHGDGDGNWIGRAEAARRAAVRTFVNGAKTRGLNWALSNQEAFELMMKQCHYCGDAPDKEYGHGTNRMIRNGIDRVDNSRGYELDNVVPCCWDCNRIKMDSNADEFIAHCKKIVDHVASHQ